MLFFTNYIQIRQISVRIPPELDLDLFFKLESGRIRISDKNGNIRPDPDRDSESGTSLVLI